MYNTYPSRKLRGALSYTFGIYRLIWSVVLEWVAGNNGDGWKIEAFL